MRDTELKRMWNDPRHWTRWGFYRAADDPRWWVIKRPPAFGWTINVARSGAWLSLLALILSCAAPAILAALLRQPLLALLGAVMPMIWIVGIAAVVSRRDP